MFKNIYNMFTKPNSIAANQYFTVIGSIPKTSLILLLLGVLFLQGCTYVKQWRASGGSRADGIVELSFILEGGLGIKAIADPEQGISEALPRCIAWGYSKTEPFGFIDQKCQFFDWIKSCVYTQKYQCIK